MFYITWPNFSSLRREGGSGVIFACLAHTKVSFIAEQLLFTERRYRAVSKLWESAVGQLFYRGNLVTLVDIFLFFEFLIFFWKYGRCVQNFGHFCNFVHNFGHIFKKKSKTFWHEVISSFRKKWLFSDKRYFHMSQTCKSDPGPPSRLKNRKKSIKSKKV